MTPVSAATLFGLVLILSFPWQAHTVAPRAPAHPLPLLCQTDPKLCRNGLLVRPPHELVIGLPGI